MNQISCLQTSHVKIHELKQVLYISKVVFKFLVQEPIDVIFCFVLGFICGIFDGHAGPACAQVISKRLLRYIAASTTETETLRNEILKGCTSQSFLKCHNDKVSL